MATQSNFKRAAPAGQQAALASLRNTQLVDAKAVLPAGLFPLEQHYDALSNFDRIDRYDSRLPTYT